MKYRCKNCGYIYSYPLEEITNCIMCNNPKTDIVEWDIDEGFIKTEKDYLINYDEVIDWLKSRDKRGE